MAIQSDGTGLSTAASGVVKHHARTVAGLPPPDETWKYCNTDIEISRLRQFYRHGIIVCVEKYTEREPNVWRVEKSAYAVASRMAEKTDALECCGATGVRNVEGTLRCKGCDREVPREEFKRVIGPL